MKKFIYISFLFWPLVLSAIEKTKEEKVAKYIIENIQKDYVTCYCFYKVSAETFKKAGKKKYIIDGLEKSADITLKFNYDLGEVLGLPAKKWLKQIKRELKSLQKLQKMIFHL